MEDELLQDSCLTPTPHRRRLPAPPGARAPPPPPTPSNGRRATEHI
ncbi:hypothetical protein ACP70R_001964 [Stipagrostis hirtigluma subsp. patula]